MLEVALLLGAVRAVMDRRAGTAVATSGVVALAAGLVALVAVLGATRMLVRNRRMRISRRVPVQVAD